MNAVTDESLAKLVGAIRCRGRVSCSGRLLPYPTSNQAMPAAELVGMVINKKAAIWQKIAAFRRGSRNWSAVYFLDFAGRAPAVTGVGPEVGGVLAEVLAVAEGRPVAEPRPEAALMEKGLEKLAEPD